MYFYCSVWKHIEQKAAACFTKLYVRKLMLLLLFIDSIFFHLQSFFQSKLFPTISLYWEKYQAKLLEKVKAIQGGIVLAGDGRRDSMGHSAKFGAYTMFCCTLPMIIHFALIQVRVKTHGLFCKC